MLVSVCCVDNVPVATDSAGYYGQWCQARLRAEKPATVATTPALLTITDHHCDHCDIITNDHHHIITDDHHDHDHWLKWSSISFIRILHMIISRSTTSSSTTKVSVQNVWDFTGICVVISFSLTFFRSFNQKLFQNFWSVLSSLTYIYTIMPLKKIFLCICL